MLRHLIGGLLICCSFLAIAQTPSTYYTTENLPFVSKVCKDLFNIQLHLPKSINAVSEAYQYPLIILLDQQNVNTYQQNMANINYLTQWGHQMPEAIVMGVPLGGHQERYYYTSFEQKEGDSLTGIEKMEQLLFEELIPYLREDVAPIHHITIIGHSRTAYLVNYLVTKRCLEFDAAVAASGFYHDGNGKVEQAFEEALPALLAQRTRPFNYYMTAGNTRVEMTYKNACDRLATRWEALGTPDQLHWAYQIHPHANHMTNFVQTVPYALLDLFAHYSFILDDWFEWKQNTYTGEEAVTIYKQDLQASKTGIHYMPSILHLMSLTSSFYNKEDYQTAIQLLTFGESYWPKEISLQLFLADCYKALGQPKNMQQHLDKYQQYKTTSSYTSEELEEAEEWYLELTSEE